MIIWGLLPEEGVWERGSAACPWPLRTAAEMRAEPRFKGKKESMPIGRQPFPYSWTNSNDQVTIAMVSNSLSLLY